MRRVALLLCLLMLAVPLSARADGTAKITWQADRTGLAAWLMAAGADEASAQQYAAPAEQLMQALALTLSWSDEPERLMLAWSMKDQTLVDVDVCSSEAGLCLGSNLLPGVVLTLDRDTLAELFGDLGQSDPDWLHGLLAQADNVTEQTGAVIGDAFHGGMRSKTFDVDLNQLSQGLHGICRLVYSGADELIGLSCTLLDLSDEQLATLSVGMEENVWRAVLGYGTAEHTCFLDAFVDLRDPDEYTADVALYTDDQAQGFAAASAQPENCLTAHHIAWTVQETDSGAELAGRIQTLVPGSGLLHTSLCGVFGQDGGLVSWEENAAVGETDVFSCRISCTQQAMTDWPDHTADIPVDVERGDPNSLLPKAIDEGMDGFMLKLFKNVPVELLMFFFGL